MAFSFVIVCLDGAHPCKRAWAQKMMKSQFDHRERYETYSTERERISPGSLSAVTVKGRQQISQSVVKLWEGTLVSMEISKD